LKTKTIAQQSVNVITLGCSKNLVDSEVLMGQLRANNINVTHENNQKSDVIIINTCGFIENAKQESIDTILTYIEEKQKGNIQKLYVTGCLSERYKEELTVEMPEVDAFFGTLALPELLSKFNVNYQHELIGQRTLTTPKHYAYLKISEGCNRTCAFCAIPLMRGKHVSRTIEDLIKETKHLVRNGVKEIMLIAQELTYYGLDIYKKRCLSTLLEQLSKIDGLMWIRLHYCYPYDFPMDVIDTMAQFPNICNYIDIPLQHANNTILTAMHRHTTQEYMLSLIDTFRQKIPEIGIRTTMLVGFPNETEAQFEDLCRFVQNVKFNRLGSFTYSHEEGTRGYDLTDNISAELKQERMQTLMNIQEPISLELNKKHIGTTMKVLFDDKTKEHFVGRTEYDSPEVDNEVLVFAHNNFVRLGDFANVIITESTAFELYGHVVT